MHEDYEDLKCQQNLIGESDVHNIFFNADYYWYQILAHLFGLQENGWYNYVCYNVFASYCF